MLFALALLRNRIARLQFAVLDKRLPLHTLVCQRYISSMSESPRGGKRPLDRVEDEEEGEETAQRKPVPASTSARSQGWSPFPSLLKRWYSSPEKNTEYWQKLPLEEKRKQYKCGSKFLTLDRISTWPEFYKKNKCKPAIGPPKYLVDPALNDKVSLLEGDITRLEIDAIVNAANSSLMGGGGVDGAIHSAAGYSLKDECAELGGCDTGNTKLTTGHRLPAKYILHTVGPINGSAEKLSSCYTTCLRLVEEHGIKSIAFCCIATGVYGFPNDMATNIALDITRKWLDGNADKIDRIIFVVFLKKDYKLYTTLMQQYFPLLPSSSADSSPPSTPPAEETDKETGSVPSLKKNLTAPAKTYITSTTPLSVKEEKEKSVVEEEKQVQEISGEREGKEDSEGGEVEKQGGGVETVEEGKVERMEDGSGGKEEEDVKTYITSMTPSSVKEEKEKSVVEEEKQVQEISGEREGKEDSEGGEVEKQGGGAETMEEGSGGKEEEDGVKPDDEESMETEEEKGRVKGKGNSWVESKSGKEESEESGKREDEGQRTDQRETKEGSRKETSID